LQECSSKISTAEPVENFFEKKFAGFGKDTTFAPAFEKERVFNP
jgi:hypothetical protein